MATDQKQKLFVPPAGLDEEPGDRMPLADGQADEILTRTELMEWLKIGHNALHQLLDDGLPVVKAGNRWIFVKSFVLAWLWDQSQKRTPGGANRPDK